MRDTIIGRDIEFYTGCVEQHQRALRQCHPKREEAVKQVLASAENLLEALKAYGKALDDYIS